MAIGSQVSSGAKLEMAVGGNVVAYANNASYTVNHNHQPIERFGEVEVNEHAELGVTVEFTASMFRVDQQAAISLGMQPRIADFLKQPELTVTLKDKTKDSVLLTVNGVKLQSRSGTVDARGVWTETLTFVGRIVFDETGQQGVL